MNIQIKLFDDFAVRFKFFLRFYKSLKDFHKSLIAFVFPLKTFQKLSCLDRIPPW